MGTIYVLHSSHAVLPMRKWKIRKLHFFSSFGKKMSTKSLKYHHKSHHTACQQNIMATTWLRQLVSGLSPQKPKLDPLIYVRLMVNKVAMGQVCLQVLWISPVNIIPPVLCTNLLILHWSYTILVREIIIKEHILCASFLCQSAQMHG